MAHAVETADALPFADDKSIISQLLDRALGLFEGDRLSARRLVEQARALAEGQARAQLVGPGALAAWQARRIEGFVDENFSHPIRVDEVASLIALSPGHFSRAFRATFGMTFTHHVIQRRIAKAKELLLNTDATIIDIAFDCGLSDQSHLTRLFKRAVGLPPNAWRRAARCPVRLHGEGLAPDVVAKSR